jgi:hypothetical protein
VDRLVPDVGTPAAVRTAMTSTITGGDIVCLHDGLGHAGTRPHSAEAQLLRARRRVEVAALGDVLDSLAGRGLLVGSVGDLRAAAARTAPAPASGTAAPRG